MIRARKLKTLKEIKTLDKNSADIFCPSIVDTWYPNRPNDLESVNLYDFVKWYDIVKIEPKCTKDKSIQYYKLGDSLYIKKRKRGYLINHYKYKADTQPEYYYFSLLLLFHPWRDTNELKNGCDTFAEAFLSLNSELTEALQYHERITEILKALDNVKEQIENEEAKNENENNSFDIPSGCVPIEVDSAMKDFQDVGDKVQTVDVKQMVEDLNLDQKRIFDKVVNTVTSEREILRLYVSGEGGTGKSFLIKTIRCWLKQVVEKDTAVSAPTGIAAFNIDGLTIHRLFQLPVEHGYTPKYVSLSDAVLKIIRDELKNVALIIIDEVSMISDVTFMYIHKRLEEIFNTGDVEDGWFGKKHILLFGDLLQLPPVNEDPAFIKFTQSKADKYLGALSTFHLWAELFSYEELTINMRQQNDQPYRELLSRLRIGVTTDSDIQLLEPKKINFISSNCRNRLQELCNYINSLPFDTVCLFPTNNFCNVLNEAMLSQIPSEEIQLIAHDTIDCGKMKHLMKKVSKVLSTDNEDTSRTAGIARIIIVKVGAKVMIRRNIDVTLGLVNGTIATVISVSRTIDKNDVDSIKIVLSSGAEQIIERVSVKFQVMEGVFVMRKQFPLCLSYGITIHKSQGLSLKNAVIDAGNSIFCDG